MGGRVVNIVGLAIVGIIIADGLARPAGLTAAFNGFGNLWSTTVNGLQASAVK